MNSLRTIQLHHITFHDGNEIHRASKTNHEYLGTKKLCTSNNIQETRRKKINLLSFFGDASSPTASAGEWLLNIRVIFVFMDAYDLKKRSIMSEPLPTTALAPAATPLKPQTPPPPTPTPPPPFSPPYVQDIAVASVAHRSGFNLFQYPVRFRGW